jgi:hypothetical protein
MRKFFSILLLVSFGLSSFVIEIFRLIFFSVYLEWSLLLQVF